MRFKCTSTDPVPELTEQGWAKAGVDLFHGRAHFVGPATLVVKDDRLVGRRVPQPIADENYAALVRGGDRGRGRNAWGGSVIEHFGAMDTTALEGRSRSRHDSLRLAEDTES